MTIQMPSSRGHSITVIGAISEKQGLVHYSIINGSNDGTHFANFVSGLVKKVKGEAVVYMDNLSVHYTKRVRDFFNARVSQRFLPAYSCSLNPIERLWLVVKGKWRKAMLENGDNLEDDQCLDILKKLMDE
jgi:transposase